MSTSYFVLSKSCSGRVDDRDELISMCGRREENVYLLPSVNFSYYFGNGLFESSLIEWSRQFCSKDKVFLDIGAHTGTYGISLARSCERVYCFEPQRMTFYGLCGGVALSNLKNVECFRLGLGSEEQVGKMSLKVVSHDGGELIIENSDVPCSCCRRQGSVILFPSYLLHKMEVITRGTRYSMVVFAHGRPFR